MSKKIKKVTVDDYYHQIELAVTKALVIFNALGYNSNSNKDNWVNDGHDGITDMITDLVEGCINSIEKGEEWISHSTGMIKVEMAIEEGKKKPVLEILFILSW